MRASRRPTVTSEQDMLKVGIDIDVGERALETRRAKNGKCQTCGTQTHKVGFMGKKTPLTVEGEVFQGRCLGCHPLEGYTRRPQGPTKTQQFTAIQPTARAYNAIPRASTIPVGDQQQTSPTLPAQRPPLPQMHSRRHQQLPPPVPVQYEQTTQPLQQQVQPPVPRPLPQQQQSFVVPRTLEVAAYDDTDNLSVVSGITMDVRLVQGARNFDPSNNVRYDSDEDDANMPTVRRRPGPELSNSGDDPHVDSRPNPGRRPSRKAPAPPARNSYREYAPGIPNRDPHPMPSVTEGGPVGLDADGYPIANNNHGWNNQDDMLPPGGMDALFQKRSAAAVTPAQTYDQNEIVLQGDNENGEETFLTPPTNLSSVVSGPMYQMDDSPAYAEHEVPSQSYPRQQMSNPPSYTSRTHGDHQFAQKRMDRNSFVESQKQPSMSPPLRDSRLRGRPDDDMISDPMSNFAPGGERLGQESFAMSHLQNVPVASASSPSADRVSNMMRKLSTPPTMKQKDQNSPKRQQTEATIHEIPAILHCLNLDQANSHMRIKAFNSLAEIMWKSGEKARDFISQHKGIDTLVKGMWEEIGNAEVQDAALHFLFSLAASSDGRASSDILSNQESICDSLLFSMQTHASVPSIQLKGCSILACLASASSNNKKISDGTLSGAQMMALNALSYHKNSKEIQKAGIQALYFQCSLSENAESNKRSLMDSTLENGLSGIETIIDAMAQLIDDVIAMEWACKMCWCLTSSEDLVKLVSGELGVMEQVMKTCQFNMGKQEAAGLIEASFGVFGNLAHLENTRSNLQQIGVIPVLIDAMRYYQNDVGVNIEACSAIANLSLSSPIRDSIVAAGGVGSVIQALEVFVESSDCVAEAVRALVCMGIDSIDGRNQMSLPEVVNLTSQAVVRHQETSLLQEMGSTLIACLAVDPAVTGMIIDNGGVEILIEALSEGSDGKSKDAAILAIRNLSCQVKNCEALLHPGAMNGIIKAMNSHEDSDIIHTNACCALWNLAFQSSNPPGTIVGTDAVNSVVKAMQSNMESGDLLELACGALWCIMDHSVDRGRDIVAGGAIDAVACAMVMHPNRIPLLEKACGFFSCASLEESLAETIARFQGVSIVVEVMRNNSTDIALLEFGCLVLRNIIYVLPDLAQEASAAVSVVINAMKENMDALSFQREACNLLWVLASERESCQSKILALDGVATLMKCLEHNSSESPVQEAALGAFNQLAVTKNDE